MLREEGKIDADEGQPEMQFAEKFRIHVSGHLREPVVPAREDREDGAEREHIVEVRDDVVRIVKVAVNAGVGEHDAGHAADREQEDESDGPQHRCLEFNRAAPHGRDPGKDLDAGRYRDHHARDGEEGLGVGRQTSREHMMCPDDEADAR